MTDSVVSLSRHSCVREAHNLPESVAAEKSGAAASLATSGSDSLVEEGDHGLDGAAEDDDLLDVGRALIGVALLDVVEAEVEREGLGQQREKLALLQLVAQDRGVALARRTNGQTGRGVTEGKTNKIKRTKAYRNKQN